MLHSSLSARLGAAAIGYETSTLRGVGAANTSRRNQLAHDIHDHIGSNLSLALRSLDLHEAELAGPGNSRNRIADARRALQDTFRFTRTVVSGLRAYELRDSLQSEIDTWTRSAAEGSTLVKVGINGDESWVPAPLREEIFLVIRECLRNALTHAAASRIEGEVTIAPDNVVCVIEDDGRGFDPHIARTGSGGGMASMRERITALGGTLQILGRPGLGTRVYLQLPLMSAADVTERTESAGRVG
jgi:signal transduction histidine kinase